MRDLVDLHVAVVRGRQEALRVWRKHQRPDGHGVALQLVHELGRLGIEHIDDPVDSPAGDVLSVRTLKNKVILLCTLQSWVQFEYHSSALTILPAG